MDVTAQSRTSYCAENVIKNIHYFFRSATMHYPSRGLPEKWILVHITDLRLLLSNQQCNPSRLIKFSNHNLIAFNYFWMALPLDSVKYYVEQTIYSIPICRLIWIGILSSSSNIINCYFPEVSNLIAAAISLAVQLCEQNNGGIQTVWPFVVPQMMSCSFF